MTDIHPEGCILKVDYDYPEKLHKIYKVSLFWAEHFILPGSKLPKLMTTLYFHWKYILHYRDSNIESVLDLVKKIV